MHHYGHYSGSIWLDQTLEIMNLLTYLEGPVFGNANYASLFCFIQIYKNSFSFIQILTDILFLNIYSINYKYIRYNFFFYCLSKQRPLLEFMMKNSSHWACTSKK